MLYVNLTKRLYSYLISRSLIRVTKTINKNSFAYVRTMMPFDENDYRECNGILRKMNLYFSKDDAENKFTFIDFVIKKMKNHVNQVDFVSEDNSHFFKFVDNSSEMKKINFLKLVLCNDETDALPSNDFSGNSI